MKTIETAPTFAIEYTDKNTGKSTRGIYRYMLQWVAEQEAAKLQAKADAIGRPVIIRAVATGETRQIK